MGRIRDAGAAEDALGTQRDNGAWSHAHGGENVSDRLRLILLSAVMLFVELVLIRWTGSNVIHLSYFSNFVLLGSFLGIGVGFLRAGKAAELFRMAPLTLALLVVCVLVFPINVDRQGAQIIYFTAARTTGLPPYLTLPVIFLVVALVMAMIAEGVARTFATFKPLDAYRLDISGSILGIALFSLLSLLHAPPLAWGLVVSVAFAALLWPRLGPLQILPLLVLVIALGIETFQPNVSWSPYYKIATHSLTSAGGDRFINVEANGVPHQNIESIAVRKKTEPIYFTVYDRIQDNALRDVLIVGAGTGSDVAIALSEGAQHIDAVEIDPRLYQLGKELHPDRPYDDTRVDVHITDGRAFLERTKKRYDLILFSLPDSLTLVSGQSSLRLESYLFTREAMDTAREHLRPGGAFAMYNYYRETWLVDRLAKTVQAAHGPSPCFDNVSAQGGLSLLTDSPYPGAVRCAGNAWSPLSTVEPSPATDDHPFVYLRDNAIPSLYLWTIALVLLASLALVRANSGPLGEMRGYADLFFMGVAFLLLETKSVVQFSLLFGTTWFVNALVFAGVLIVVLAAILVARRLRAGNAFVLYGLLLVSLVVAWVTPPASLLDLDPVPRFLAAVAVAFTPIFLANLVFAERFKGVGASTVAFGANLLGAMVGGLVEYAALITGYRTLLIVTGVLYGLAFVTGRRHFRSFEPPPDSGGVGEPRNPVQPDLLPDS
jgi:hypothetical protein